MRVPGVALAVGAAASLLLGFDAHACGESLFRVGRGAAYRAQTAPLPGNVLLVAPNAEAKALADRLMAAGHHVRVVETADLIAAELRNDRFDVVLASYNDRELVAEQTVGATASYIPVTTEDGQETLAAQSFERHLAATDNLARFLKVIHRTLQASHAS